MQGRTGNTGRPRAAEWGLSVGGFPSGAHNALTDVPGVRVGHTTVRRSPDIHSGVTAILPGERVSPQRPVAAGVFTGNGYGKLIGSTQLAELGELETPVLLTSTLSAFRVADALVGWMLERPECAEAVSLNPVVGECNDGYLSDIRARPVREEHVRAALDGASAGPVEEGCVGAGTGTGALGFKAGIGTASRVVELPGEGARYTLGALVQANFGGTLRIGGELLTPGGLGLRPEAPPPEKGSCMIVVGTDAPLDARQLGRLARRAVFALARVGAAYGHGSGDYAIAFSTSGATRRASEARYSERSAPVGERPRPAPADSALNPLFEAALDTVEESVLNSLLAAVTTTGHRGRTLPALPVEALRRRPPGPGPGPHGG
ncbi:P1 family peptidase [Streptomyces sp. P38-E01]|uniref:P1 family peptidase n=1 Tax=Streptomyces tardus TaxID=2780544 RepID=A0A949N7X2_9ACTN|nr:P1 family peptidase [Streptomyces tardus]MBU7600562.1 P1 family peptidase [Streptomyces tardus]